jgi:hypothetical protein
MLWLLTHSVFFTLGLVSHFFWVAFMEAIGLSIPRGWKEY